MRERCVNGERKAESGKRKAESAISPLNALSLTVDRSRDLAASCPSCCLNRNYPQPSKPTSRLACPATYPLLYKALEHAYDLSEQNEVKTPDAFLARLAECLDETQHDLVNFLTIRADRDFPDQNIVRCAANS